MSSSEGSPERGAFQALEGAVGRALDELERLRAALAASERRRGELGELLDGFRQGRRDPAEMATRLEALERENADLRRRVSQGREGVERLLARIRFLEDQR